ncbi:MULTISPECIES: ATP-grasp domain-containing protein [Proteus]|uniref:ATP-grasp domain-containing protein n=1 Tax=Proteus penneri TaxID=102862 RepID=A0ABS0W750_9GAMM|nr:MULTISPECIES: ATP-grasp domain-containing protein [Proteus]MBJ2119141.1 ATP-grasp domain-containing protein [Proteus penneri]MCO8051521.1 ATP-grasp domain-containing protein [Proteus penneri]MCX2588869.1 ATP-grasp domain-containing protein [Proteus penneri]NBL76385.1 ATP-grasp domain-containing protein [Proteus sp. G2672]NBL90570.1 ATP-grasp domain-containing protein [Proteus sp. G2673]
MNDKYVLIVDPFSSGAIFANRVKELYGYNVIALITNNNLPPTIVSTFKEEDYSAVFNYASHEEAAQQIELALGRAPDFIICGSEPGVLIFDLLCHRWNLLPNLFKLSQARRDKYLMQKQLMLDGIRYIPHYRSGQLSKILTWCEENPFKEYVIKPVCSFGTEGVFFCKNTAEIKNAFNLLINTFDYSGNKNKELLIEQKINGIEYVVDAVSSNGVHFIVNIFKYLKQKVNGIPIYHQMVTEPVNLFPELVDYTKSVLTSLGIKNGTSHNEIIMSSNGPVLIESGARMHGGLGPSLVERCNSHSLIDMSLLVRIAPHQFTDAICTSPVLQRYAVEYFLCAPNQGHIKEINIEKQCSTLKSYGFTICKYKPNDYLQKTTDLVTSYGRIVLFNEEYLALSTDVQVVADLEKKGALISII